MKHLVTLLFISFFGLTLSAQVTEEEMNDLLNSREIQVDNPMISNFLMIRQISSDNEIISIQDNPGDARNDILVNQNGTRNKGYVKQNGSGHETRLWQYESENEANLWSEGSNTLTSVKQDGDGNTINSYIKNLDLERRSAILLQEGNNNRIDLALFGDGVPTGVTSQEVKITQKGNNHAVEAFMEDAFAPIEITQDAGINGDGMQISVSNSFFNFPMK